MSPRTFLKARRPERFSDSVVIEELPLDGTILEYQLDTLTSRNQEADFERFARLLAEREVCPNLIPHTGPTGGGDSKVDTETYPVAEPLALAWFINGALQAATERWAFAFSAKKRWRPKLQEDIAKIAKTGRGYTKAIFVTNQSVPDKARAELEDSLTKEHGLEVRIFDRAWIVERVFKGRHEQLAIDELRLQASARTIVRKGPYDTRREQELTEIDAEIERATRADQIDVALVAHTLQSALLARGLERPRHEVEGRFSRARQIAQQHGTPHQRIVIAYQEAFGAFWWYEDYPVFLEKLAAFETQVAASDNIYHLELATTLHHALHAAVVEKKLNDDSACLDERADSLLTKLDAASKLEYRPSAALQAEALSLFIQLPRVAADHIDGLLVELNTVVERSKGLLGFPLCAVADSITDLAAVFGDRAPFNELHDSLVAAIAERRGGVHAARLLLKRGAQQLDAEKPYEAIRSIGKALTRLYTEESRRELIRALYFLAAAYEAVGLLWASRGSLLHAASNATSHFWETEEVTFRQTACYDRLRWLELRLGRVPHALAWHEATLAAKSVLARHGADPERLSFGEREFDATFGILLLRVDFRELKWLVKLPGVLKNCSLGLADLALRFALGHEDDVKKELGNDREGAIDPNDFFRELLGQPVSAEIPDSAFLYTGRTATLKSVILGLPITAETEIESPCIELAESILAGLESLLATALVDTAILPRVASLNIRFRRSHLDERRFRWEVQEIDGHAHVEIHVSQWNPHKLTAAEQSQLREMLRDLLAYLLGRAFFVNNPENTLTRLFRDEQAIDRAINFTGSFVAVSNVLGDRPNYTLDPWLERDLPEFPLLRSTPWNPPTNSQADGTAAKPKPEDEQKVAPGLSRAKHTDIATISHIQSSLWDEADWWATSFLTPAGEGGIPALAPVFRNEGPARRIFQQWRDEIGAIDAQEALRVSIVRGVTTDNPHAYRIVIGTDPDEISRRSTGRLFVTTSRINLMDAKSSVNLDRFLASFVRAGRYELAPGFCSTGDIESARFAPALIVEKRKLQVVNAWEVGPNDFESAAIVGDYRPIIPDDRMHDAPVLSILAKRKRQ